MSAVSRLDRTFGIVRSVVTYYGIPLRARRLRRFYSQFVTSGSLCFDVGAHAGNRVRCWLQLNARVVAIEPQPDFVRLLRFLYGRNKNVEIVAAALGRAGGRGTLLVSERTPTVTTLSADWIDEVRTDPRFAGVRWAPDRPVEILTLQSLIERHGLPRFVKIDVEGFEAEVLAGLEVAVPFLSFEYLAAARTTALACIDRLEQLGVYRYNHSSGETHRLELASWVDADAAREFITALPPDAPSGDLYASLVSPRRPLARAA
jgi:FkbM family methyltransferase